MKRLRTTQLKGFSLRLTITDSAGGVHTYLRRRKTSFLYLLTRWETFKKAHLMVHYTRKYYNDGVYTNKADLLNAYQIFTEKDLILDMISPEKK